MTSIRDVLFDAPRRRFLKAMGLGLTGMVLPGCSPDQSDQNPAERNPPAKEQSAVSNQRPTASQTPLTFWFTFTNHEPEYKARQAEIEKKFNVRLHFEIFNQDELLDRLGTALMAGNGYPDIVEAGSRHYHHFIRGTEGDIPYLNLTRVFADSPYNGQVMKDRLAMYTKNGKLYGLPHDVHPTLMLYNDAAWKSYGIEMAKVTTWDGFLTACEAVGKQATLPDGRRRYCIMDWASGGAMAALLAQNGLWWVDAAGRSILTSPKFKSVVRNWLRFRDYWIDLDWVNQVEMLKSGQVLCQFAPDWLFGIHKQGTASDSEWLLHSPLRLKSVPGGPITGSWGGTAAGIIKHSPHADQAAQVLLFLYYENGNGQLHARFDRTGILPPVMSAWDDAAFSQPEPVVGGQLAGRLYIEAARNIPALTSDWRSEAVRVAWEDRANLVWAGKLGLEDAIAAAGANAASILRTRQ